MARYILIDQNSGYIWADVEAVDPMSAAIAADRETGDYGHEYREVSASDASAAYHVYTVPADFPAVTDGQSQEQIDNLDVAGRHEVSLARVREI